MMISDSGNGGGEYEHVCAWVRFVCSLRVVSGVLYEAGCNKKFRNEWTNERGTS